MFRSTLAHLSTAAFFVAALAFFLSPYALAHAADPLGTAFTYQGQLKSGSTAFSGSCDMQFKLYDALSGGAQIGATLNPTGIAVAGGLFTVSLDFGVGVFAGDRRFLDIAVKCGADASFTALTPRQELTAAPYALYAQTASSAADAWNLTGNGGTNSATNFVGTTDDTTLVARVNSIIGWRLLPSGTNTPNVVGGYSGNSVTGGVYGAVIGGGGESGDLNTVTDVYGTIGGGTNNQAGDNAGTTFDGVFATVGGGRNNTASADTATVGGGGSNTAGGEGATVGGGGANTAGAQLATVGGGGSNRAGGILATVAGGNGNSAGGFAATVGGGQSNTASGQYATVGAGQSNTASGDGSVIGGGTNNQATDETNTISGGHLNQTSDANTTVSGGYQNNASADAATIGGGGLNKASAFFATIGGGESNTASDDSSTIGGGSNNTASGTFATIGGGDKNQANSNHATVSGGKSNTASGQFATVGGGQMNTAGNLNATVGGGAVNTAGGDHATVSGGFNNSASGDGGAIGGGQNNTAAGDYSFVVGRRAKNTDDSHDGVFLFADSSNFDFSSTAANQFRARATGGVQFVTAIDGSGNDAAGVKLDPGDGSWSSLSDRNAKQNFSAIDPREMLRRVANMPILRWNYKAQDASIQHIGPMAQDFYAAFNVGSDAQHITTIDADGVSLAAIQGLNQIVQEQNSRIDLLEQQNAGLQMQLTILELGALLATVAGGGIWLKRRRRAKFG